jgi:WD40 repeat protein
MRVMRGHTGPVWALAYSPVGRLLASGGSDGTVRVWDLADGRELVAPFDHGHCVHGLAFAPDGRFLASIGQDRHVRLWDVDNAREGPTLPPLTSVPTAVASFPAAPHGPFLAVAGGLVTCLAISPDGKTVAAGSGEPVDFRRGVVTVFENDGLIRTVSLHLTDMGHWRAVYPKEGREDELGGGVRVVKLWMPYSDRRLPALPHRNGVRAVAFSPEGAVLATAAGSAIRLWDPATWHELAVLKGHVYYVIGLAFTPDGGALLSGGIDRTVRLWDVAGRRQRATYSWPTGKVYALAVAPDGLTAAAAGDGSDIVVWDLEE